MTTDKPSHLVPKLRFPEFRDTPGWSETPLGEILTPIVREREKPEVPYTGLGIRSHGRGTFRKELEQPEKTSMERLYEVDCNDLIVNITFAWEGAIAIVRPEDSGALVSHRFPTYQFVQNAVLPEFFRYPILDKQFIYSLGVISPGGAGRNRVLNKTDFLNIELGLPKVAEQQKIANCLGSLDDLIAAEGRKLEALRQHKKALMQQLLPLPGETVPRLRFPEFRNKGEWRPHRFGDFVVKSFYGTSASTSEKGQYPVLRMGNMRDGRLDFSNLVYINLDPEEFECLRLQKGDILLNRTNSRDLVGKISIFDRDSECITASYIVSFRLDENRIDPWFCNLMLNTQMLQSRIKLLATPSISQANINPATFRTGLDIVIPKLAEQQRIAACLTSLDGALAAQSRKVEGLKVHKQGLLQQLFPRTEEESR